MRNWNEIFQFSIEYFSHSQCTSLETELQSEKTNHEQAVIELNSEISNLKKEPDESQVDNQTEEFQMKLSLIQVIILCKYIC